MPTVLERLNLAAACRAQHLGLWSCPPFLFVVMGFVNIAAMLSSWLLANRYVAEPHLVALTVIAVSTMIFIIGYSVTHGFMKIAETNRIKSEFIGIVSHQLRSPLAVFKWTLETLARGTPPAAPDAAGHLETLREQTEKMIQMINMLLEVSRLEGGRLLLRREPVRLERLTEKILRSYADYARAMRVTLEYATPPGLPPVRGDAEKLTMVAQNLLDNAIRYSPSGGRVRIAIGAKGPELLEWKVEDTGVGIPAAEQRNVFKKFFRSETAVRRQAHGSGLGLYIAASFVTALGGEIGFHSEEGKGSAFWFRLPVYQT